MYAITVHQPYAAAIVDGPCRVVNLAREPRLRPGTDVAIFASARRWRPSPTENAELRRLWSDLPPSSRLVYGAIIGVARVAGVVAGDAPLVAGDVWTSGPWCVRLARVEPIDTPVPAMGGRAIWFVNDDLERKMFGRDKLTRQRNGVIVLGAAPVRLRSLEDVGLDPDA